jgi:hypothetical protein
MGMYIGQILGMVESREGNKGGKLYLRYEVSAKFSANNNFNYNG